jgi:arsenate reductase
MIKLIVLVLCTGNSCRSQLAEGFLRKYHGDEYDVHSAGTSPADRVHPMALRVMADAGIDISSHEPKGVNRYLGREAVRHILIVCDHANQTCPRVWPGTFSRTYLPFEDPADFEGTEQQTLAKFREVLFQIDGAMRDWRPEAQTVAGRRQHRPLTCSIRPIWGDREDENLAFATVSIA